MIEDSGEKTDGRTRHVLFTGGYNLREEVSGKVFVGGEIPSL
ncbi:MAG TPA: hypothetical protein VJT71_04420 [Pyrinomonadaceae bacterium]|nr:hypothetical protein [Pyrinomonadaceae bacterium]